LQAYLSDWFGTSDPLHLKQTFWDRPMTASDRAQVQSCRDSLFSWLRFLAATARHGGDWLFVLPIASYGLELDDDIMSLKVVQIQRIIWKSVSYARVVKFCAR